MDVVTPTDFSKSIRNRCIIDVFVAFFFVLSRVNFEFSVSKGAFVLPSILNMINTSLVYPTQNYRWTKQFMSQKIPFLDWPRPNYEWFPWSICNWCGMPAGNAYTSGHLVPSLFLGLAYAPSKTDVPRDVRSLNVRKQDKFRRDWSQHSNTCKSQSGIGPGFR